MNRNCAKKKVLYVEIKHKRGEPKARRHDTRTSGKDQMKRRNKRVFNNTNYSFSPFALWPMGGN